MALQLVDRAGGGEVRLVSMAPRRCAVCARRWRWAPPRPSSCATRRSQGSDALGTAKVLAAAIERVERPDLVIAATESTDGSPAPCPSRSPSCGPAVDHVRGARRDRRRHGEGPRQTEAGYDEVGEPLPAIVVGHAGVVEPRYPSFKGIMAAKKQAGRGAQGRGSRHRCRPSIGPERDKRSPTSRPPRPARPVRWSKTTARRTRRCRVPRGLKVI